MKLNFKSYIYSYIANLMILFKIKFDTLSLFNKKYITLKKIKKALFRRGEG